MKNILLIYGHALSHSSLRELLNDDLYLRLADEAGSVQEALHLIKTHEYDMVILDVSAPEKNGLETFCDLKQTAPDLPILIINGSESTDRMVHFLRLGCAGYLPYSTDSAQVLTAMKTIARKQPYHLPEQQAMMNDKRHLLHERLSLRELQVFFKLIKGQPVNAIAIELAIAPGSVSVFRSKILKKMDASNNAALIHYALAYQLTPPIGGASKPMSLSS
jgi:DNA-binding NarL/FixJ family response regulator